MLVAPSTAQDPECELLRAALEALADEPVRVVATTNRHRPERPIEVPANAVLVDWLLYSQAMPAADVVICHGGHGTVARALAAGAPVLVLPGGRRHGRERGAGGVVGRGADGAVAAARRRGAIGLATRRLLGEERFGGGPGEIAAWSSGNDGAERGAELVEAAARDATSRLSPARQS